MKHSRLFLCVLVAVVTTLVALTCTSDPLHLKPLLGLHQPVVSSVSTSAIAVDSTTDAIQDSAYLAILEPLKQQLAAEMNVRLGTAPETFWVGQPECPMLNWASDALLSAARRLYPGQVDIAIVNIGGMRCEWPQGEVTRQSVFELMPFDNRLVVLTLSGQDIENLCISFAQQGGQGVAGMRMAAEDGQVIEVMIGDDHLQPERSYHVATSDYLATGSDRMEALTNYSDYWDSDCLIRDLYIDEVTRQQTIRAVVDGRMNVYKTH